MASFFELLVIYLLVVAGLAAFFRYQTRSPMHAWATIAVGCGMFGALTLLMTARIGGMERTGPAKATAVLLLIAACAAGVFWQRARYAAGDLLPAKLTDLVTVMYEKNFVLYGIGGDRLYAQNASSKPRRVTAKVTGRDGLESAPVVLTLSPGMAASIPLHVWGTVAGTVEFPVAVNVSGSGGKRIIAEIGAAQAPAVDMTEGANAALMVGTFVASGGAVVASARGRSGLWVTLTGVPETRPPQPSPHTLSVPSRAELEVALRAGV
jgi:hypothetical protein